MSVNTNLLEELRALRDRQLTLAAELEQVIAKANDGRLILSTPRDLQAEGRAMRLLREERGADRTLMAKWVGKKEADIAAIEQGRVGLTDTEIAAFAEGLRMERVALQNWLSLAHE